jgi:hypothetical protein
LIEPFIYPETFWLAFATQRTKIGRIIAKKLVKFAVVLFLLDIPFKLKHLC